MDMTLCYFRQRLAGQFHNNLLILPSDLTVANRIYIGDTGAFYFDNISAEDVNLLPLKQTYKSFIFISVIMDVFWQAGSDQQAQQSTHLAEGLNPL